MTALALKVRNLPLWISRHRFAQRQPGRLVDVHCVAAARWEWLHHAQAAQAGEPDGAFLRRDPQQGGKDGFITPVRDGSGFKGFLERGALGVRQRGIGEIHGGQRQLRRIALGRLEHTQLFSEIHVTSWAEELGQQAGFVTSETTRGFHLRQRQIGAVLLAVFEPFRWWRGHKLERGACH